MKFKLRSVLSSILPTPRQEDWPHIPIQKLPANDHLAIGLVRDERKNKKSGDEIAAEKARIRLLEERARLSSPETHLR